MKYDTIDIPYDEYYDIFKDALKYDDISDFIDHWFVPEGDLKLIWETAHVTPHEIRLYTGLSVSEFARWCLASRRTVEEWELHKEKHGNRYCAMMAWRAGMYPEPSFDGEPVSRDSLGLSDERYFDVFTDAVHAESSEGITERNGLSPDELSIIYKTAHVQTKEIRTYLGMTQKEFAKWALVGPSIVQQWEYGTRKSTPGWNAFLAWRAGMYPEP